MLIVKLRKIGNSFGVIIPKVIARLAGIEVGQELRMEVTGEPGYITVSPHRDRANRQKRERRKR